MSWKSTRVNPLFVLGGGVAIAALFKAIGEASRDREVIELKKRNELLEARDRVLNGPKQG